MITSSSTRVFCLACFAAAMSAPIYLHLPFLSFTVCDLILMHFSSWALLFPSSPCQIELHRRPEHSKPSPSAVRRPRSFPVPHSVKATQPNQPASEAGPGEGALAVIIDRAVSSSSSSFSSASVAVGTFVPLYQFGGRRRLALAAPLPPLIPHTCTLFVVHLIPFRVILGPSMPPDKA